MNGSIPRLSNPRTGYSPETSVFIVGGSVFGLSSAYHLALAGYKNITVFDRTGSLPSPHAASHDLNKIIRAEYGVGHATDDFYTELALVSCLVFCPIDNNSTGECTHRAYEIIRG